MRDIFHSAYMRPEIDSDGDLAVRGRTGFTHIVQVQERQGIIAIICSFRFRDDLDHNERLDAVNKLNDGKVLARFSVTVTGSLYADYHLLIEEGLTPFQILNCFTRFDNVVVGSLEEMKDLIR